MRKVMLAIVAVMVSGSLCYAGGFKIGAHGAYPVNGDVQENNFGYGVQIGLEFNDNFALELAGTMFQDKLGGEVGVEDLMAAATAASGLGVAVPTLTAADLAQATAMMTAYGISLPMTVEVGDMDVKNLVLVAKLGGKLGEKVRAFVGGGVSYNMFDVDWSIADVANSTGLAPLITAQTGMTPEMLDSMAQAAMAAYGVSVDLEVDNTIGFLLLAGLEWRPSDNLGIFVEYDYNFIKPDVSVSYDASTLAALAAANGVAGIPMSGSQSVGDMDYNFGMIKAGVNIVF